MTILHRLKVLVTENQILIVLLALVAGLVFPSTFRPINLFSTELLILVFFTSSIRLSLHELFDYARDWRLLLASTFFMLVFLPFALYIPFSFFSPAWAIALLILGAMPTGMTIALIADFFGGKTSLALLITAATSLLAPFTIPLVFEIAIGRSVPIPLLQMFWSLFLTIVIPFILAMLVKKSVPHFVTKYDHAFRYLSIIAFGLLIAGVVADTSRASFPAPTGIDLVALLLFTIWMGVLTWFSYRLVSWRAPDERITVALSMVYLNNTLALFIGNRFFASQGVMPKLLLLLLVINVLLPPIKWAAGHLTKTPHQFNKNPLT